MSQPEVVCRNKGRVELKAERESLSRQRILCCNIAEEECKHYYRDTLNFVVTMIMANGKETLSRQFFLCRIIIG